jgi:hypothetical protein
MKHKRIGGFSKSKKRIGNAKTRSNNDANTGACLFLLFVAGLWRRSFSFSAFKPSVKKAY